MFGKKERRRMIVWTSDRAWSHGMNTEEGRITLGRLRRERHRRLLRLAIWWITTVVVALLGWGLRFLK